MPGKLWYVHRVKSPFSNFSGFLWMKPQSPKALQRQATQIALRNRKQVSLLCTQREEDAIKFWGIFILIYQYFLGNSCLFQNSLDVRGKWTTTGEKLDRVLPCFTLWFHLFFLYYLFAFSGEFDWNPLEQDHMTNKHPAKHIINSQRTLT